MPVLFEHRSDEWYQELHRRTQAMMEYSRLTESEMYDAKVANTLQQCILARVT